MKKIVQSLFFLSVYSLQAGLSGLSNAGFNSGDSGTTSLNSSNGTASATPAVPTNFAFQATDWQYLLLPVFQKYASSGLTTYFYKGNNLIPDNAFQNFLNFTQSADSVNSKNNPLYGGQSDYLMPYKVKISSLNTISFNPKLFLEYQGSTILQKDKPGYGTGWYKSAFYQNAIETFIQNGSGNTVAQYASALVENFAGRLAVAGSAFVNSSAQVNGGLLGQVNPQVGPISLSLVAHSNEPQIITSFFNAAQNAFQQARYARIMYTFATTSDSVQSGSTPGLSEQLNAASSSFIIPSNQNDPNFGNTNQSALNPINTFCGIIVINDTQYDIQQVGNNNQTWGASVHQNKELSNVFFLPATSLLVNPNPSQVAPYNSYAPVDQSANTVTNSSTTVTRTVSFNLVSPATLQGNAATGGQTTTISVSNQPASGDSAQLPVYINDGTSDLSFNPTDMNNFFMIPNQWAVVVKMSETIENQGGASTANFNLIDLGLVKLNPYDFPLNYTTSLMQSVLGISNQENANVSTSTSQIFSQSNPLFNKEKNSLSDLSNSIFDAPFYLYAMAFPQEKSMDYSFAYLMLQGMCNGYLMSNTYNTIFSTNEWPQAKSYSQAYKNYYDVAFYNSSSLLLDQVFPTPLASDWLGKNSSLDWLFLRAFIAMRLVLQSIYCPYDALVIPARYILTEQDNAYIKVDPQMSVLEYMFSNPNQTAVIATSLTQSKASYRIIYGQNYTSGTTASVSGLYQWLLPIVNQEGN